VTLPGLYHFTVIADRVPQAIAGAERTQLPGIDDVIF